jgi:hypothetical protein
MGDPGKDIVITLQEAAHNLSQTAAHLIRCADHVPKNAEAEIRILGEETWDVCDRPGSIIHRLQVELEGAVD